MENVKKNVILVYETMTDNFEGDVKHFVSERIINYTDLAEELQDLAECSDGEMSHSPLYLLNLERRVIYNYGASR